MRTWSTPLADALWSSANSVNTGTHIADPVPALHQVAHSRAVHSVREPLSDRGVRFIASLAQRVSLRQTATHFPHLANRLATLRSTPPATIAFIDSLIIDDRPDREGLPFAVLNELSQLRAYVDKRAHARGLLR